MVDKQDATALADELGYWATHGTMMPARRTLLFDAAASLRATSQTPDARVRCDGLMTCAAAEFDGVLCADDTCDFDTGVRKPPTPSASAGPQAEAVDWQYRFRDPHKNAPWGPWKRMQGSVEENRVLFARRIIGEPDRDETKMAVEFRPLYAHPHPQPPQAAGRGVVIEALKLAINHIDHMAAWITEANSDYHVGVYSFESLGEDMPDIRAALQQSSGE